MGENCPLNFLGVLRCFCATCFPTRLLIMNIKFCIVELNPKRCKDRKKTEKKCAVSLRELHSTPPTFLLNLC